MLSGAAFKLVPAVVLQANFSIKNCIFMGAFSCSLDRILSLCETEIGSAVLLEVSHPSHSLSFAKF